MSAYLELSAGEPLIRLGVRQFTMCSSGIRSALAGKRVNLVVSSEVQRIAGARTGTVVRQALSCIEAAKARSHTIDLQAATK